MHINDGIMIIPHELMRNWDSSSLGDSHLTFSSTLQVVGIFIAFGAMLIFTIRRINLLVGWVRRGQTFNPAMRYVIFGFLFCVFAACVYGNVSYWTSLPAGQQIFATLAATIAMTCAAFGIWLTSRLSRRRIMTPISDGLRAAPARAIAARARQTSQRAVSAHRKLEKSHSSMVEELELASRVQANLFKQQDYGEHVRIAHWSEAAGAVTGDILCSWVGGGHDGKAQNIFIGDATGHGVSAALLAVSVHVAIKDMDPNYTPAQILYRLNRLLVSDNDDMFVTGAIIRIETDGRLTFLNAGHPPAIVKLSNGQRVMLTNTGTALGMFSNNLYLDEPSSLQLSPHDSVLLVTDGLTELRGANSEQFGLGRLSDAFARAQRAGDMTETLRLVREEVSAFANTQDRWQPDDALAVCIEYAGAMSQKVRRDTDGFAARL